MLDYYIICKLILQNNNKKPQGRWGEVLKPKKASLALQRVSSTSQSENSLNLELQGAPFTQRAQIQEPGLAALRKGCEETPKNKVFCFTATQEPKPERDSPANIHQGAVSATFGHCFPDTDSYRIIILQLLKNKGAFPEPQRA